MQIESFFSLIQEAKLRLLHHSDCLISFASNKVDMKVKDGNGSISSSCLEYYCAKVSCNINLQAMLVYKFPIYTYIHNYHVLRKSVALGE